MASYIFAIDQGTTSSATIALDENFAVVASDQAEFTQHFRADDMVEHDVDEIWHSIISTCRNAISNSGIEPKEIAGMRAGVWPDMEGFSKSWKLRDRFEPNLAEAERDRKYEGWKRAVQITINQIA